MSRVRRALVVTTAAAMALVAAGCRDDEAVSGAVDIFAGLRGAEADLFVDSLRSARSLRNVDISYIGSQNFVDDLSNRVRTDGDPPDIALIPQPGVVRDLLSVNALVPLDEATLAALDEHLTPETRALGQVAEVQVAVPYRLTAKSLVWYRPDVFTARGWEIPTDLAELGALADRIEADGDLAPWCFSMQSGAATGWAATDWVEDWVLRRGGPQVYDSWVAGELPFGSPVVADAFEGFRDLVLAPGRTAGDTRDIVLTPVEQQAEIFASPDAPCAMYKQADLALAWFPGGIEIGPDGDIDFFVLPSGTDPAPMLVGGFLAVAFDDRPEVHAVMQALASPEGSAVWRETGNFIGPIDVDDGQDTVSGRITSLLADGRVLRFDGSDSMPAAVGTRLLWDAITEWVAGSITQEELATQVDEAFAEVLASGG